MLTNTLAVGCELLGWVCVCVLCGSWCRLLEPPWFLSCCGLLLFVLRQQLYCAVPTSVVSQLVSVFILLYLCCCIRIVRVPARLLVLVVEGLSYCPHTLHKACEP